jgi:hypothetical protein
MTFEARHLLFLYFRKGTAFGGNAPTGMIAR